MLWRIALFALCSVAFGQPTTPTISMVSNAATYSTTLCPGLLAVVYGANFGSNTAVINVTVGGKPAYVAPSSAVSTQVTIEVPFELAPGPTTVTISVANVASQPFNVTLAAVSPGFFADPYGYACLFIAGNRDTIRAGSSRRRFDDVRRWPGSDESGDSHRSSGHRESRRDDADAQHWRRHGNSFVRRTYATRHLPG